MYNITYHNFNLKQSDHKQLTNISKSMIDSIESGDSYYQIFKKQSPSDFLKSLTQIAEQIRNFSDLIVISMGGATLNPEMVIRFLTSKNNCPKIYFLNNTDPAFFAELLSLINIKTTAILAISNSGQTLETNALVGCMLGEFSRNNVTNIGKRSFFITNSKKGVLKEVAMSLKATIIPHHEAISGRYSGLSSVTILISLVAGINVEELIGGANNVITDFYENKEISKPAISAGSIFYNDKSLLVNIGYLQKFEIFLEWYSQIIAESLGKEGKGYTPIRGLGPNDQHSMLQLFLDGPKDKLFSLFYAKSSDAERLQYKISNIKELDYLAGKNLDEINLVNFQATLEAIISRNLSVRTIILDQVSAKSFGAIMCHCMLEIVMIANLMKINPFNQPGVELIKTRSTALLAEK